MSGKSSIESFNRRDDPWSRARKRRNAEKSNASHRPHDASTLPILGLSTIIQKRVNEGLSRVAELEGRVVASERKYEELRLEAAETQNQVREQKVKLDQSTSELAKMDSQVKNDKLQAIQILALFVAFFTFVSVEFQLFNNVRSPGALVALSLMLLGALTIFIGVTYLGLAYYVGRTKASENKAQANEDDEPSDEPDTALQFNMDFIKSITAIAVMLLASGAALNFWLVSNDLHATRDKAVVCARLGEDIKTELEKPESKAADFMKLRYQTECGTPQSPK